MRIPGINVAIGLVVTLMATSPSASVAYADGGSGVSKRLVLFQGFILNAYYNDQYVEVKRLDVNGTIYGYGWVDDDTVFVAYQRPNQAEAVVDVDLINLRQLRTTKQKILGAGGESNFDVNPSTGEVVFNTDDAVKLLKFDTKTNSHRIDVISSGFCWGVFWIDSKTVGCKLVEKDKLKFVKYAVPQTTR